MDVFLSVYLRIGRVTQRLLFAIQLFSHSMYLSRGCEFNLFGDQASILCGLVRFPDNRFELHSKVRYWELSTLIMSIYMYIYGDFSRWDCPLVPFQLTIKESKQSNPKEQSISLTLGMIYRHAWSVLFLHCSIVILPPAGLDGWTRETRK